MKKATPNATWLHSPPEKDQLSPVLTAKCQTCYQSLAECEVSQLFDVLNMKSDHRTKQLSATSTCQKQSTPIIIEFLSCMHLLCRHWGVLQYRGANKDFRQFSKINITGFTCLHQKAADDRLQIQSKTHPLSRALWEKVKWFAATQSGVSVPTLYCDLENMTLTLSKVLRINSNTITGSQITHCKLWELHAVSLMTLRGESEKVLAECVAMLCCPNRYVPSESDAAFGMIPLDRWVLLEC